MAEFFPRSIDCFRRNACKCDHFVAETFGTMASKLRVTQGILRDGERSPINGASELFFSVVFSRQVLALLVVVDFCPSQRLSLLCLFVLGCDA